MGLGGGELGRALEDHRRGHVDEPLHVAIQRGAHDRRADRAGAAGDQHAAHGRAWATATSAAGANTCPAPRQFHGSTTRQSGPASSAIARSASGRPNSEWLVATTTAAAPATASSK